MKKAKLAYGKGILEIGVPDAAVVIEPRHLQGLQDEREQCWLPCASRSARLLYANW